MKHLPRFQHFTLRHEAQAGSPGGARVRLDRLTKRYGDLLAVRELSLDVAPGEFLTLLGPSGSGKTTTLMMVAGFEFPTSGRVAIAGQDLTLCPAHRRDLGVVFQHYALFPHMSVFDNIAFPLRVRRYGKGEIRRRVNAMLEMVRLSGLGSHLPRQLSGGMQQRVALARALVFGPQVLLLDEPLAALDRKLRESLQLEIKRIQQTLGVTVLYVTHDQTEALTLSDRIAVIDHGRIVQLGNASELYENPADAFIAHFLGECNFLRGTLQSVEPATRHGVVRLRSGQLVTGEIAAGVVPSGQVILGIRPEHCVIRDRSDSAATLVGAVQQVTYLGDVTKVTVALPGEEETLMVKQLNGEGRHVPARGETVGVGWSSASVRIFSGLDGIELDGCHQDEQK